MEVRKVSYIRVREGIRGLTIMTGTLIALVIAYDWRDPDSFILFVILAYLVMFVLLTINFFVISCYLMNMLGLGKDTKSKIFWRHVMIIISYIVSNTYLVYAIFLKIYCSYCN